MVPKQLGAQKSENQTALASLQAQGTLNQLSCPRDLRLLPHSHSGVLQLHIAWPATQCRHGVSALKTSYPISLAAWASNTHRTSINLQDIMTMRTYTWSFLCFCPHKQALYKQLGCILYVSLKSDSCDQGEVGIFLCADIFLSLNLLLSILIITLSIFTYLSLYSGFVSLIAWTAGKFQHDYHTKDELIFPELTPVIFQLICSS